MKKNLLILVGAALAAVLGGCSSSDGPFGDKGVDWYVAHKDERAQQMKWCADLSQAARAASAGCTQASQAELKSSVNGKMPAGY